MHRLSKKQATNPVATRSGLLASSTSRFVFGLRCRRSASTSSVANEKPPRKKKGKRNWKQANAIHRKGSPIQGKMGKLPFRPRNVWDKVPIVDRSAEIDAVRAESREQVLCGRRTATSQKKLSNSQRCALRNTLGYVETCLFGIDSAIQSGGSNDCGLQTQSESKAATRGRVQCLSGPKMEWSVVKEDICEMAGLSEAKMRKVLRNRVPHIDLDLKSEEIIRDAHIARVQVAANGMLPPSIEWSNRLVFDQLYSRRNRNGKEFWQSRVLDAIESEVINCSLALPITAESNEDEDSAHMSVDLSALSAEARMIAARGLDSALMSAFHKLTATVEFKKRRRLSLTHDEYLHLALNLGLDPRAVARVMDVGTANDEEEDCAKYGSVNVPIPPVEVTKLWLQNFAAANRQNGKNGAQNAKKEKVRVSHLDLMPHIFETKVLDKLGRLLHYIEWYRRSLLSPAIGAQKSAGIGSPPHPFATRHPYEFRVYNEEQVLDGQCPIGRQRCTPDVVLSQPVCVNGAPVYWFDAKCTRALTCLNDAKKRYQMLRFTKEYGPGAIVAIGAADLSVVGINDVIVLDGSHWL